MSEPRKAPEVASEAAPEAPGSRGAPIEAHFRVEGEPAAALVPLARVTELTAGLVERIADLAARNEGLALEVGQLRERTAGQGTQLAAKEETIAELRRRAEAAEAERDALRARLEAAQASPAAPGATAVTETALGPLPVWRRLLRVLRGA